MPVIKRVLARWCCYRKSFWFEPELCTCRQAQDRIRHNSTIDPFHCETSQTGSGPLSSPAWRRLLAAVARGGTAYTFGGGADARAGSGLSFARIALRVWMRAE